MGLDDYLLLRWNCKEWVCYKRERKDGLLMHVFFVVLTLLSFTLLFLLFSVISPSILSISCLSHYLASIYGYCYYLCWVNLMGFLYFTLIAYQLFLSAMSTLSKLPLSPLATWPPLHLGMPSAFSLFHYLFHDKFLSIWFCVSLFLSFQRTKFWVSFYLFLWHASSGLSHLLSILDKDAFLAKYLPKEALIGYHK